MPNQHHDTSAFERLAEHDDRFVLPQDLTDDLVLVFAVLDEDDLDRDALDHAGAHLLGPVVADERARHPGHERATAVAAQVGRRRQSDAVLRACESVPVRKQAVPGTPPPRSAPGGDDQPHVYAGTLAVAGHGKVEVTATGRRSQMGQIGASLAGIAHEDTLLQTALRKLVRLLSVIALTLSAGLVFWYGLLHGDWLQGVLSAIVARIAATS